MVHQSIRIDLRKVRSQYVIMAMRRVKLQYCSCLFTEDKTECGIRSMAFDYSLSYTELGVGRDVTS